MWTWFLSLAVTYLLLWALPFWLVWPAGVLLSLYLVRIIQRRRGGLLEDRHVLGVLLGALCSVYYGLTVFLLR